jgi:alpha-tubulin suppressor-like RCC1 family protein
VRVRSGFQAIGTAGLCVVVLLAVGAALAPRASASSVGFAWGDGEFGVLGNGTTESSGFPLAMAGLDEVAAVTGGWHHTLALLSDGEVLAWGENSHGQLGDGSTENSLAPVTVSGLSGVSAIAATGQQSLALLSDGEVRAWGENEDGQLGDGTRTDKHTPVAVAGITSAIAIATSGGHSLALLSDGTVMAWGDNDLGELGDGTTKSSDVPVAVSGLSEATAIAAGSDDSLALLENGEIRAWGSNGEGQLGNGKSPDGDYPEPTAVSGIDEATAIAAGSEDSVALLRGGEVDAWGLDIAGQLGDGQKGQAGERDLPTPVLAPGSGSEPLTGVTAIAAAYWDAYALTSSGQLLAWGNDAYGELGDGRSGEGTISTRPVPVLCRLQGIAGFGAGERAGFAWGAPNELCPVVGSVTPDEGLPSAETPVTITGTGFAGATAVDFGSRPAASFSVESNTEITAVAPPGTGTVDVSVTTAQGTSLPSVSDRFSYAGSPSIARVQRDTGSAAGGVHIEIEGDNLGNVTAVDFGGHPAAHFSTTVNSIEVEGVPPGEPGIVDITVTNPSGTSEVTPADRFTYEQAPEFGSCRNNVGGETEFKSATCEIRSEAKHPYEWFPAFGGIHPLAKRTFTLSSGALTLATKDRTTIACTGSSAPGGEYTGGKGVALGTLTLTGCRDGSVACTSSGAGEGELRTAPLGGQLGFAAKGRKQGGGMELSPSGSEPFAAFSCGETPGTLRGSVVLEVPLGKKMSTTTTWKASEKDGVQHYTMLEGGAPAILELKLGAGASYEQAGLSSSLTQTSAEAVEIDSKI